MVGGKRGIKAGSREGLAGDGGGVRGWGNSRGFGLCPLASCCASSSQCKGLELPLDGIFSPVASAIPSIHLEGCRRVASQSPGDTAVKNKSQGGGQEVRGRRGCGVRPAAPLI